ncbi:MAG: hypothetical protein MUC95_00770 [Spirochaetes bacterium]|jgi:hypothetical protein|nr:hypothetical protein [Spirochaetota bacterium]
MTSYFFWDIENVSFHNLDNIMIRVRESEGETISCAVYSRIKESRKEVLLENGWILVPTEGVARNSADKKIKVMIELIIGDKNNQPKKISIITEDRGFYKISKQIIEKGINLEIICGTKNPPWIKKLSRLKPDVENNVIV